MNDHVSKSRGEVDKQLAFALYGAASRMARMHKPHLEPLGLTFPQYLVMLELLDVAPVSVGELGGRVGMDTGTITPLVKRLQASSLVTRTRDTVDERRVLVDLTPEGRALDVEIRGVAGKITSACKLTDDNVDELRRSLENLAGGVSG
ncbi:MarR family winged helix-turn-helix transcriptional regulator [Sphingomonas sp. CFBP 8760]|uniref:MarR family winged helix-turn-helix transcriptional regulator n=1 Tax=Sphingomonas sp. CFBP 8760 TaxID=2775282 RepID=UPI0017872E3D|nr:MarR family winged helix-turn-helix transcriptional regulator [Sphingomonas sp. CFBP 8760]MBD8546835.1 winged helix-turn-helix transcriptional regulator [Sphingomonas sp. CFBP 8760]